MAERVVDLQRCGYKLIQDSDSHCFGGDAVLLSSFAKVKKNESALDLGCGTGVIPILLCAKTEGKSFTGLEIQEKLAETARRNVELNGLTGRVNIITGDIKDINNIFGAGSFDVVTANPPYIRVNDGPAGVSDMRSVATREILIDLRGVISGAARVLKNGGRFYMVHRPERLVEIVNLLTEFKLEMKTLRFVQAAADKKPSAALIAATHRGKARLNVMPPLVICAGPGVYTREAEDIYNG